MIEDFDLENVDFNSNLNALMIQLMMSEQQIFECNELIKNREANLKSDNHLLMFSKEELKNDVSEAYNGLENALNNRYKAMNDLYIRLHDVLMKDIK